MGVLLQSLCETLIADFFSLAYPISLYFLYEENKLLNCYTTIAIISLSIIYFINYLITKAKEEEGCKCAYFIVQYLFCIIGYLVQFHLAFLDVFEIIDGNLKINTALLILKIFMILETLKRIYFYVLGIILLLSLECHPKGDPSLYVMSFEIVYFYLWSDFYQNFFSGGYELPICYKIISLFVCLIYGALALGNYFLAVKICFGVFNLGFLFAHTYSIYWRYRENY